MTRLSASRSRDTLLAQSSACNQAPSASATTMAQGGSTPQPDHIASNLASARGGCDLVLAQAELAAVRSWGGCRRRAGFAAGLRALGGVPGGPALSGWPQGARLCRRRRRGRLNGGGRRGASRNRRSRDPGAVVALASPSASSAIPASSGSRGMPGRARRQSLPPDQRAAQARCARQSPHRS